MLLITDDWITIVEGLQADPTTLSVADFDNAGSVNLPTEGIDSGSRKDITSVTTSAYNAFTLNNTGRSWISLSDYSTFALREGHDVLDIAYDGPASTQNSLTFRANEYTGISYDPILEVTYTQPITILTDEVDYSYDHAMRRVSKTQDSTTTLYPSSDYSVEGATTTAYVQGPSGLVAQIEDDGVTSTTQTLHTDHLGSTSVVTDESGIMVELLDYHPYGTERISWSLETGGVQTDKTYIGEYSDDETGLSYLNARYYDPGRGQFLGQDPAFLDIGVNDEIFKEKYERKLIQHLLDPQALNSYSYGLGNPVLNSDPEGAIAPLAAAIAWAVVEVGLSAYDAYTAYQTANDPNASALEKGLTAGGFVAGLLAPGGGYGKVTNEVFSSVSNYFQKEGVTLTQHALQRVIQRADQGITPKGVVDALRSGERFIDTWHNNTVFLKNGVRVSVDKDNVVRTVVSESRDLNTVDRFIKVEE